MFEPRTETKYWREFRREAASCLSVASHRIRESNFELICRLARKLRGRHSSKSRACDPQIFCVTQSFLLESVLFLLGARGLSPGGAAEQDPLTVRACVTQRFPRLPDVFVDIAHLVCPDQEWRLPVRRPVLTFTSCVTQSFDAVDRTSQYPEALVLRAEGLLVARMI